VVTACGATVVAALDVVWALVDPGASLAAELLPPGFAAELLPPGLAAVVPFVVAAALAPITKRAAKSKIVVVRPSILLMLSGCLVER